MGSDVAEHENHSIQYYIQYMTVMGINMGSQGSQGVWCRTESSAVLSMFEEHR